MVHRVRILDPTLMFPKSLPSADMESMVFFKPRGTVEHCPFIVDFANEMVMFHSKLWVVLKMCYTTKWF